MFKLLIALFVVSHGVAHDIPCPQFCFVNTTGPQLNFTYFQGQAFYKNKHYMVTIEPYKYLMLADSTSSYDRYNIYNFDKWILSEQVLVGQIYSSSTETIIVGFECKLDDKAFTNITNSCMDTIMYMSPEFCNSDYMMLSYRSDLICSA